MIPYVEIIGKYTLLPFAVVEPSQCWFELSYYDIGEFEVYCPATEVALNALRNGNYVRIPNKPYLWVIKSVQYTFNAEGARMIDAKGFEAKWIIGQRIIQTPWQLPTNLANAVFSLVDGNLGATAVSYRKIIGFVTESPRIAVSIDSTTQATRGNLWEFLSALLKANHCGSYCYYEDGEIHFQAFEGRDKTASILFAQSMDNLISADYFENSAERRNYIQIVSTHTENNQTDECVSQYPDTASSHPSTGIDRLEMTIASNISTKYKDEQGQEQETAFGSDLYKSWQVEEGKNQLAERKLITEFSGDIDLQFSQYEFEKDFFIGDLVKVRDEYFGYSADARITKYTFKQDEKGYGEEAEYGE